MPTRLGRLTVLLFCLFFSTREAAFAALAVEPSPAATAVHQKITRRGVGHVVKLVRTDGSEVTGRISTIGDTAVDLQQKGSAQIVTVNYTDIAKVKGPGLSTGAKVGIGVGVGLLLAVGIAAIVINHEIKKPWNF